VVVGTHLTYYLSRPELWQPPIELSPTEQSIVKRIKRAKLFTLRECRHELFDQSFQQELSKLYADSVCGHPPFHPHNWHW